MRGWTKIVYLYPWQKFYPSGSIIFETTSVCFAMEVFCWGVGIYTIRWKTALRTNFVSPKPLFFEGEWLTKDGYSNLPAKQLKVTCEIKTNNQFLRAIHIIPLRLTILYLFDSLQLIQPKKEVRKKKHKLGSIQPLMKFYDSSCNDMNTIYFSCIVQYQVHERSFMTFIELKSLRISHIRYTTNITTTNKC